MDKATVIKLPRAGAKRSAATQRPRTALSPDDVIKDALKDKVLRRDAEILFYQMPSLLQVCKRLAFHFLDVVPSGSEGSQPLFHKCLHQALNDWNKLQHTPVTIETEIKQIPTFIGGLVRHTHEILECEVHVVGDDNHIKWNALETSMSDWLSAHSHKGEVHISKKGGTVNDIDVHLIRKCIASRILSQHDLIAVGGKLDNLIRHIDGESVVGVR